MDNRINLKSWAYAENQTIKLEYEDGDTLHVKKVDFDRAFGAIASADKRDVLRDFAIRAPLDKTLNEAYARAQEEHADCRGAPPREGNPLGR